MCFTQSFICFTLQSVRRCLKLKLIETVFSVCLILALEAVISECNWWGLAFSWPKLIFSYCMWLRDCLEFSLFELVTRSADNKSLTTVEWRCLKTIFHWRLSTQLLSRLREVVWVSFWPPGRKSPLDSWEKECCQSNGRILCFVNWLIRSNAMSLAVPEINKPWFYFNTPKAFISFPLNYTEQMACLLC